MKRNWTTPEEIKRKKQLKKRLLYISIPVVTVLASAVVTILANQI
ncbi:MULTISPECIES: hypothetical protein [Bacillus]|uniref:Uncharacterized protein n=1 Tax=Bacillus infantis NRRL B-14911 TaxID=1367477 RepID=U5LEL8_9BACI|nr:MULTISPECIES: hypothetical protein [Bacillus]AGX06284.1 hypothetical protein N288_22220 [Bacillus infantis NRRL B-14911]MDT0162122.1 hypothetical protein [Bacillus sp. AG4(2022)]